MIRVAITGNIASGKSAVEEILKSKGFCVFDADKIAHKILNESREIFEFAQKYGVIEDGVISREKLGKLVFSDIHVKNQLESIIHPKVKQEILNLFEQNMDKKYVFVSVPLLFEAGMENIFDKVVLVYAPNDLRLKRLISRNGYTEDYAKARLKSQQNQDSKICKSDYVIYNDSTMQKLEEQTLKLIE